MKITTSKTKNKSVKIPMEIWIRLCDAIECSPDLANFEMIIKKINLYRESNIKLRKRKYFKAE